MNNLTPAMQQYHRFKEQYKDCILMFRMGDFYEMFYDDAIAASRVLDITLTSRTVRDQKIPLAGVPYHSVDPYIAKFVKQGYKLAICEQVEDPKLAKGIVKRDVVRVITPGTFFGNSLENAANNYTISIFPNNERFGIAIADLSTGDFIARKAKNTEELFSALAVYPPSEMIVPNSLFVNKEFTKQLQQLAFTEGYYDTAFISENASAALKKHFKVESLEGFGLSNALAISAAGALLIYLKDTQKRELDFINRIRVIAPKKYMILDETTQKNLELTTNIIDHSKKCTLLAIIDKTKTAMGARLIKRWLTQPLMNIDAIKIRLDAVEELARKTIIRKDMQALLAKIQDIERLITKISYGNSTPRDLIALKNSARVLPLIKKELAKCNSKLFKILSELDTLEEAHNLIDKAIKDEPSALATEGNIIKKGYNPELDKLLDVKSNGKNYLRELESKEKAATGIKNLKVRYNKVFGYFIEVTKANTKLVPEHYIRKQTLVNSERYITEELKTHEDMILNAEEKTIELEKQLFEEAVKQIALYTPQTQDTAKKIAALDTICSLAQVAVDSCYTKPKVNQKSLISIEAGRHAVLEIATESFVPNSCALNNYEMMIITGPNMSGKSTYMRQVALIVILAQMGSFVPASKAEIGIVDRIFTRVGAHDDLVHGQSTFMVEMTETANILNNATSKSLIILDEIGRGTSTFDGVALAWSVAEHIYKKIKAKTLFATHYHVLNKLAASFENIKNFNIAVKEDEDEVIFLRKIVPGATDKSYGIHVAKLAGMPRDVVERAKEIQNKLEKEDEMLRKVKAKKDVTQMDLLDVVKY
ncbi:DNA mismatch repair protein MutS [Candidatus Woesearchaeota archaeon]|nr:DNA mismatch repair protein MutS [Candidatus Woesearchaeota archaeon]